MKLSIFRPNSDQPYKNKYVSSQDQKFINFKNELLQNRRSSLDMYQQSVTNRLLERPLINTLNKLVNKVAPKLALQKKVPLPKPDFKPVDVFELEKSYPAKMKALRALAPEVVGELSLQYAKPREVLPPSPVAKPYW
jgi:hypothetical protein